MAITNKICRADVTAASLYVDSFQPGYTNVRWFGLSDGGKLPDLRASVTLVFDGLDIPAGSRVDAAKIEVTAESTTNPTSHDAVRMAILRPDGGLDGEPGDDKYFRNYQSHIACEVGTSGDTTAVTDLYLGAYPGGGGAGSLQHYTWIEFVPSPLGFDAPTTAHLDSPSRYTQIIKSDSTVTVTQIGLYINDVSTFTEDATFTVEVYSIVGNDVSHGAAVPDTLLGTTTSVTRNGTGGWDGVARGTMTYFDFDGAEEWDAVTGDHYMLRFHLTWTTSPPDNKGAVLLCGWCASGQLANNTPSNVAGITAGAFNLGTSSAEISQARRTHQWPYYPIASWNDTIHNYEFADGPNDAVLYIEESTDATNWTADTAYEMGNSTYSPNIEIDLANLLQQWIDEPDYVQDKTLRIAIDLKNPSSPPQQMFFYSTHNGVSADRPVLTVAWTVQPEAELAGDGTVDAQPALGNAVLAELAGDGTVDAQPVLTIPAASELAADATMDGALRLILAAHSELLGEATIDGMLSAITGFAAELLGTATLDAEFRRALIGYIVELSDTGFPVEVAAALADAALAQVRANATVAATAHTAISATATVPAVVETANIVVQIPRSLTMGPAGV